MMKKPLVLLTIFALIVMAMASIVSAVPSVTSPLSGSLVALKTVPFKFTPDVAGYSSCGIYSNRLSSTYALEGAAIANPTAVLQSINVTFSNVKKTFNWYVSCTNSTGAKINSSTSSITVISNTKLVIDEIKVEYESQGSSDTESDDVTFDFDDILSGNLDISSVAQNSEVEITLYLKNLHSTADDDDETIIEDIEITLESDDTSDIDDIDADIDEIDAGDDEKVQMTFTIPADLLEDDDSDEFDFTIFVEGEDGNGTYHDDEIKLTLEIKKPKYWIHMSDVAFTDNVLDCQRTTSLRVKFSNAGYKELDEVMLQVYSTELGLSYVEKDLELENDISDYIIKNIPFTVKDSVAPGTYKFYVKLFEDNSEKNIIDGGIASVDLTVQKCVPVVTPPVVTKPTETETTKPTTTETTKPSTIDTEYKPIVVTPTPIEEKSNIGEIATIGLLAGVNILLLVVGAFLIIKLVRK